MSATILSYPCPSCGQTVKVKAPAVSAAYKIACPHCHHKANIKLPGMDRLGPKLAAQKAKAPLPPTAQMEVKAAGEIPPTPGTPTPPPAPRPAPAPAPAPAPVAPPPAPAPAPVAPPPSPSAPAKTNIMPGVGARKGAGKLERLGKFFNDSYPLNMGIVTIGRYDEDCPSDIAIKGDQHMSRRSVQIEVAFDNVQGFTYRLRVLSATNPVTLNGQNVCVGADAFLNFGDIIGLGVTKFRLDPVK